jgi:hypothetical protein
VYVHGSPGQNVGVRALSGTTAWTNTGTYPDSLNDASNTTWVESPPDPPTFTQVRRDILRPLGPGPITITPTIRYPTDPITSARFRLYMEDGTTLVDEWTVTPTSAFVATALTVDAAGLLLIPEGTLSTRRALILESAAAV